MPSAESDNAAGCALAWLRVQESWEPEAARALVSGKHRGNRQCFPKTLSKQRHSLAVCQSKDTLRVAVCREQCWTAGMCQAVERLTVFFIFCPCPRNGHRPSAVLLLASLLAGPGPS
eukprot:2293808-Rhodomonas_salina.1